MFLSTRALKSTPGDPPKRACFPRKVSSGIRYTPRDPNGLACSDMLISINMLKRFDFRCVTCYTSSVMASKKPTPHRYSTGELEKRAEYRAKWAKRADSRAHETGRERKRDIPVQKDALYEHIARRILNHHSLRSISDATGYSTSNIRRILREPAFLQIYERTKDALYSHVDEVLYDQRAGMAARIEAGAPRAFTEIIKLIENARSERVRKEAAELALGLAGHTPIKKTIKAELPVPDLEHSAIKKLSEGLSAALASGRVSVNVTEQKVVEAEVINDTSEPSAD